MRPTSDSGRRLALAAELKRRRPGLTVVFGGSNCDGPMGHALHRNHRFVDHVVRGEGEYALPALLTHIDAGTAPADVPGLCWWDGQESRANEESRRTVAPADIPSPDYDLWQQAVDACRRSSTSSRPAAPTASNWSGSAPTSPTSRSAFRNAVPPRCTAMSMTCPRTNWPIWSTSSTPRPPGSAAGPRRG
ncbi:radical SAM superfamily enzyme YgiQ (UPF0313 family) [Streptomyces sp. TE3672]